MTDNITAPATGLINGGNPMMGIAVGIGFSLPFWATLALILL